MIFHILFNYSLLKKTMDYKIEKIMEEKILETMGKKNEIKLLIHLLPFEDPEDPEDAPTTVSPTTAFGYGIVIGRLYNSFYYQTKRVLKRQPTEDDFTDFFEFIKKQHTLFPNLGGLDSPLES